MHRYKQGTSAVVVVHGRKKRIVGRCKTIPHIREVHLGAIRQDVSSAIRMLKWMMPCIVNKGGNTVKIVPNSLFGY